MENIKVHCMIIDPLVMSGEYQSDDVHTIKFIVAFSNVINYVPGSKFNLGFAWFCSEISRSHQHI